MAASSDPVVILSAARTPLGRFMGELSPLQRAQARLPRDRRGAGTRQACAGEHRRSLHGQRAAGRPGPGAGAPGCARRGPPDATGATTINKVCGSGMKATMLAHDIINAGSAEIVLSGGMESMSNAPYLLAKARARLSRRP